MVTSNASFAFPPECFPITVTLLREDTGEIVWEEVASTAGVLRVPGFGDLGVGITTQIRYADGDRWTETSSGIEVVEEEL